MIVAVDPYLIDWLDLVLRWLHVKPRSSGSAPRSTSSRSTTTWSRRSGGGRRRGRRRRGVGGPRRRLLPRAEVHSRAEDAPREIAVVQVGGIHDVASGFALFCVLYYVDADLNLVGADMSEWAATRSARPARGSLARLRRALPRHRQRARLAAVLVALVTATAWGLSLLYTDRAVWLQLGACSGRSWWRTPFS